MEDFKHDVIRWRASLGQPPPDEETMRSLCNPQIRPIIERMMRYIRPEEEVQMVRRQVAMSKIKDKSLAEETKPEDEERVALLRKYKALKAEVQEKRAKESAQKEHIESLKREIEIKSRKASSLQYEICELHKQTITVTAMSQQLAAEVQRLSDNNCVAMYCKKVTQEQQSPPSEPSSKVRQFEAEQDKIINSIEMSVIPAPPEVTPDIPVEWHKELIELKIKNITFKKELEESTSRLEVAVDNLAQCASHVLSDSVDKEIVRQWARLQVTRQISDTLHNFLKEVISTRSDSLRLDTDYLRLVLINAEKKLNTLEEKYESVQRELIQLANDLPRNWQKIEEAAEDARSKRSEVVVQRKEAQIHLSELIDKWRSATAVEIKALYDTMTSLMERDPSLQEVLDFGTIYNDLHNILKLWAQKRTAKHGILSLPKMFTPTEDARWNELVNKKLNQTDDSEKYRKFSICEGDKHLDNLLSENDRLIQSLHDLIAVWWQPPFETAVPEDLVVNGKNILQHTAYWDRVTTFVGKR